MWRQAPFAIHPEDFESELVRHTSGLQHKEQTSTDLKIPFHQGLDGKGKLGVHPVHPKVHLAHGLMFHHRRRVGHHVPNWGKNGGVQKPKFHVPKQAVG